MSPSVPGVQWESNFREQMRRLREARRMSQSELARELRARGVSFHQQTVQKVEVGERALRLDEAYVIADLLGTDLETMTTAGRASEQELLLRVSAIDRASTTLVSEFAESWGEWLGDLEAFAAEFMRADVIDPDPALRLWIAVWVHKALLTWSAIESVAFGLDRLYGRGFDTAPDLPVIRELKHWLESQSFDDLALPNGSDHLARRLANVRPSALRHLLGDPAKVSRADLLRATTLSSSEAERVLEVFIARARKSEGEVGDGQHPEAP